MDDYPTEEELKKIKNWKGSFKDLWEYVASIWHWGDSMYKFYKHGGKYHIEIHTGGWSGNEDIIYNWEHSNCLFFFMFHSKWYRGGHYYFEIEPSLWKETLVRPKKKRKSKWTELAVDTGKLSTTVPKKVFKEVLKHIEENEKDISR